MTRLLASLLCLAVAPGVAFGAGWEAQGDTAWSRRAEGFSVSGTVSPEPAATAVASYERALAADPGNARLRFKLIEATYFEGHFVMQDRRSRKEAFSRMVALAEQAVDQDPETAEAHFWAAISWGLWGMSHGYFASARKGVAGKIRDHARMVSEIDEPFADGGGARLLGRLHTATPRIPLFTGWIDRRYGIGMLERARRISTADPRNALFLAEALLDHAPARREEAVALLREVSALEPRADYLVEQTETLEQARTALAALEPEPISARGDAR